MFKKKLQKSVGKEPPTPQIVVITLVHLFDDGNIDKNPDNNIELFFRTDGKEKNPDGTEKKLSHDRSDYQLVLLTRESPTGKITDDINPDGTPHYKRVIVKDTGYIEQFLTYNYVITPNRKISRRYMCYGLSKVKNVNELQHMPTVQLRGAHNEIVCVGVDIPTGTKFTLIDEHYQIEEPGAPVPPPPVPSLSTDKILSDKPGASNSPRSNRPKTTAPAVPQITTIGPPLSEPPPGTKDERVAKETAAAAKAEAASTSTSTPRTNIFPTKSSSLSLSPRRELPPPPPVSPPSPAVPDAPIVDAVTQATAEATQSTAEATPATSTSTSPAAAAAAAAPEVPPSAVLISEPYTFITFDPTNKDQIIAVDKSKHCLQVINRKDGKIVRTIGRQGPGTLQFNEPGEIAIDSISKNIIVADQKNSRVQVIGYDAAGSVNHIRNIVMPANKFEGKWAPYSVAAVKIGDKGHVLVYSFASDNIQLLSIDDGKFIRTIKLPKKTVDDGPRTHVNIALDKYGNIIVVDGQNNCMQVMDNVSNVSGDVQAEIRGRKYFNGPRGVAVVHDAAIDHETIVVADTGNNRIQVFDLSYDDGGGRYTYPIPSKFEYNGPKSVETTGTDQFKRPYGILVDDDTSEIIVSDDKSPSTVISSLVPGKQPVLSPTPTPTPAAAAAASPTPAPAPEPTLSKEEYVEVPFKKDPWSFYRSLMRGYLIYSDPESDPSKVGRILHVGTTNDIRNMFNVFTFDDIVITECDMLFGMLSRISTWAKEKLKSKIPSVENVESGGDYYMEQLKDFFQQNDSHAGTDSIDFLNKLIAIDLNLVIRSGGGRQTIRRDKHTSSRATRKKYAQSGGDLKTRITEMKTRAREEMKKRITGAKTQIKEIKTRADIWKNNDGEEKIWNDKVRQYIRKSSTDPIGDDNRSETFMTQIKKINVVPTDDDDDDKDKDKADDDGLAKVMSTMTIEDYFKKIAVPVKRINTNVSTSYSEIVPAVWGHPLLMLIPFAKAMQCDIALYGKEKDGDGRFNLRAHIKHKADDEMTTVFKMNPTEFTIRILDNNTDTEAYHENVLEYMSNFALIVPKGQYTNSGIGLLDKELEIDKEEIAKKKSVEKDRDTEKRTSETTELKEINAQLDSIKNDLFNLMKTHPSYATLEDEKLKGDVSRILEGYKAEAKAKPRTSGIVRVSAGIGTSAGTSAGVEDESSAKPKEDSKTGWISSSDIVQSAKDLKQDIKNKIRRNISKPRLILRLKDLISKHATLSAKKDQLTPETSAATADI